MSYARERTWHTYPNVTYIATTNGDESSYILWNMKAMLTGQVGSVGATGLWTMYTSSDSTVGGTGTTGDGVDHWGSTYDASKVVLANNGSAHSWCILRSPQYTAGAVTNGYVYLLISGNSGGNFYVGTIRMAIAAFSSGTYQNDPTVTGSWVPGGSNAANLHGDTAGGVNAVLRAGIVSHLFLSTTGDFVHIIGKAGTANAPLHSLMVIQPVGCHANDLAPWFSYRRYSVSGVFTQSSNGLFATGNTSLSNPCIMPDGTAGFMSLMVPWAQAVLWRWPDLLTGKYPLLPVPIITWASDRWGMRGHLPDIRGISSNTYTTLPIYGTDLRDASNNIQFVCVGGLWLPTDKSINPS